MAESEETPADRLRRARIAAGYKTAAEFAAKHEIPQPTYQNHETGGRGIRLPAAKKYERLLGNVDAAWILTGNGKGLDGPRKPGRGQRDIYAPLTISVPHSGLANAEKSPPRAVRVIARVQAGAWRESPELPGDERYDVFMPVDPAYSHLELVGGEVVGTSMDLVYPPGTVLIFVNTIALGDGWMPEPGDRVIARRISREGLYETTVKEFAIDANGHAWLVPRSSDPSQTAVPAETPVDSDDEPVRIVGLVIGSYRPERRRGNGK